MFEVFPDVLVIGDDGVFVFPPELAGDVFALQHCVFVVELLHQRDGVFCEFEHFLVVFLDLLEIGRFRQSVPCGQTRGALSLFPDAVQVITSDQITLFDIFQRP